MWAVIDIGSNTIRLVIYSVEQGQPHSMLNKKYAVGLAGYVDASNRICKEGIAVLLEALSDIREILECIHPERVLPFGTATLRNTANGEEIVAMIREEIGMDVRVLTGEEEAVFDYYGALQDGIGNSGLLVDVGGGSTELTFFQNHKIVAATSFPLGSLNLYKTYVDKLLPTEKEARQIKKAVKHCLAQITLPDQELTTQPIYSVGGTARAALKLMQEKFSLVSIEYPGFRIIGHTSQYVYLTAFFFQPFSQIGDPYGSSTYLRIVRTGYDQNFHSISMWVFRVSENRIRTFFISINSLYFLEICSGTISILLAPCTSIRVRTLYRTLPSSMKSGLKFRMAVCSRAWGSKTRSVTSMPTGAKRHSLR